MHGAYLHFLTHVHDRVRANAGVNGAYLYNNYWRTRGGQDRRSEARAVTLEGGMKKEKVAQAQTKERIRFTRRRGRSKIVENFLSVIC